jgi:hypothetical protein
VYVQKKSFLLAASLCSAAGAGDGLSPFALDVTVEEFVAAMTTVDFFSFHYRFSWGETKERKQAESNDVEIKGKVKLCLLCLRRLVISLSCGADCARTGARQRKLRGRR